MFRTTHSLPFLSAPWHRDPAWQVFKIGTCNGQWRATRDAYEILTIVNDDPGNGHLADVFEWFENSCKRDNKSLRVREVWNKKFLKYLIRKRGFVRERGDDVIKHFKP